MNQDKQPSDYTILVVEDDSGFREILSQTIELFGYKTVEAGNGSEAKEIIKENSVDLVLSDIQMPMMTGVELVGWVRNLFDASFKRTEPLPFVLMTGFAHLFQTQQANELGVDNFLTKPFQDEDLKQSLAEALGIEDPEEEELSPANDPVEDYCRVSIEDFVSKTSLEMDIFVQLRKGKFLKIARSGEPIEPKRITRYKEKGLNYIYVKKEDYRKVLDFNIMLSKVLTKEDSVHIEKKKRFMAHTSEVLLENGMVNGIDEVFFNDAKEFISTAMDVLTDDSQTLSLLEILNSHTHSLYSHSLCVSVYSVMIAKQMGWQSSANLFKLSFGAIMHDIGKKEIDPVLLNKSRSELTYQERKILESHPLRGKEILESLKSASSEVVAIAYEHHENMIGQGFPRQLDGRRISPMAKIVCAADEFCLYALKNDNNPGMTAQKAMVLMEQYKKDKIDADCYAALLKVIKNDKSVKKTG